MIKSSEFGTSDKNVNDVAQNEIERRVSRFLNQELIIDESSCKSNFKSLSADNSSFSDYVKCQKK